MVVMGGIHHVEDGPTNVLPWLQSSSDHILLGYIIRNRLLQKDCFGNLVGGFSKVANLFSSFQNVIWVAFAIMVSSLHTQSWFVDVLGSGMKNYLCHQFLSPGLKPNYTTDTIYDISKACLLFLILCVPYRSWL